MLLKKQVSEHSPKVCCPRSGIFAAGEIPALVVMTEYRRKERYYEL